MIVVTPMRPGDGDGERNAPMMTAVTPGIGEDRYRVSASGKKTRNARTRSTGASAIEPCERR